MDNINDTRSENAESHKIEGSDSGNFFKKYTPPPHEPEASGEPFFIKYSPPRARDNEIDDNRPSSEAHHLPNTLSTAEPLPDSTRNRRPAALIWWGAGLALLLLAILLLFRTVPRQPAHRAEQADASIVSSQNAPSGAPEIYEPEGSDSTLSEPEGLRLSNASKTIPSLRRSFSSSDFLRDVMLARAQEFESRGLLERAEQQYSVLVRRFPGESIGQSRLNSIREILQTQRENAMARMLREEGLKKFRMGDYTAAKTDLAAAVNAGRTDIATLYGLGMSYFKLGDYSDSQRIFERCVASAPNYAPALVGLALASAETGNKDRALSLLRQALELGGGAEFTPVKIREMIDSLSPKRAASSSPQSAVPPAIPQAAFYARVIHNHDFPLTWCSGELTIVNSVVHFNASKPSHSFHFLSSEITGIQVSGDKLRFNANGQTHSLTIKGRSARDFLAALRH
ncbi:MAG TPA: tetratricopeptide repeat protein [Blastocatellia bacterium]|nr:tetratricopeptide repeat protein [Blastocatellia bacterium]